MSRVLTIPRVVVEAGGTPLSSEEARSITRVRVQQRLSLPTLCELSFNDPPGPLPTLAPGDTLRVSVPGQRVPLFEGEVTAVEHVYGPSHEREMLVRGYDLLHRLRKRQSVRAHVEVTAEDLAREMVSDLGLSVQAAESGPLWQLLIQHRQSDLELLQEVTARCGLYLAVRQNTLHLLTLEGTGPTVSLSLGESLLEARIEVNGDPACRSVTSTGWDTLKVEPHDGSVSRARVGRSVSADVSPDSVGGDGERALVGEIIEDDAHAEGLAQAELDVKVAREVTLWGTAEGNPQLRPGIPVEIAGIASELAGTYVLASVNHTIDSRMGFISEISTAPPVPQERPWGASITLGMVTQIDDPDSLGRVRVKLQAYNDVESGWMGVVSAGAGAGKGLVALPDVGDQVLVLLSQEDAAQGVVVGGLYGMEGPHDSGIESGAVKRYTLLTPGGQRVKLDDDKNIIRVENSEGSYVELAPELVRLHAATDLEIEAPGKKITIRGQAIDFERS